MEEQQQSETPKIVVKNHRAALSEAEQRQRGRELADVLAAIEGEKEQAKADAQRHKSKIDELGAHARKLRSAIQSGEEWQEVQCYERPDERRGQVELVRCDNDEVIDRRPMTREERQLALPGTEAEKPEETEGEGKPGRRKRRTDA